MKWIKISDQLPPEGEDVLVFNINSEENIIICSLRTFFCNCQGDFCFDFDEHYQEDGSTVKTHWMPLPQPPKEYNG